MPKNLSFSDKTLLDWVRPPPLGQKKSEYFLIRIFWIGRDPTYLTKSKKKTVFYASPNAHKTSFTFVILSGWSPYDFPVFTVFRKKIYSYIWSGLWWSTTWLRLLHSLEIWRREKAWEEERSKSKKNSQVEDYELLREVEINVLDIEYRTCSFSLQESGELHRPARCYEWTRGAIVKKNSIKSTIQQVKNY